MLQKTLQYHCEHMYHHNVRLLKQYQSHSSVLPICSASLQTDLSGFIFSRLELHTVKILN